MRAEQLIIKTLRRGARHVRLMALLEGGLLVAIVTSGVLFLAVVLDHALSLSAAARTALLTAILATVMYFGFTSLLVPFFRSISRLYVARRVEIAFPHFRESLTTFVEMKRRSRTRGAGPLVAHRAAEALGGVDIDAGLDTSRFVKLGYAAVALIVVAFAYSALSSKSMYVSLVRITNPWSMAAPPTRTRILSVRPGDATVVLGSDLEIAVKLAGRTPETAHIRWSRDDELWISSQMSHSEDGWIGSIDHLETDISYMVKAGDAQSRIFKIEAMEPPVLESIKARLDYPEYTMLKSRVITEGNIEAPLGTKVSIGIRSNKKLQEAHLSLLPEKIVNLSVDGAAGQGAFTVESSGSYTVHLVDSHGLSGRSPVSYDIVAIPDNPPAVALEGPPDGAVVELRKGLDFAFRASDDYGVSRMVFHFQAVEGNPGTKSFILPPERMEVSRRVTLVPELLGARPGDTVSYHLEAIDNRTPRGASSRTETYSFKVASAGQTPMGMSRDEATGDVREGEDMPGTPRPAAGEPEKQVADAPYSGATPSAESSAAERAQAYSSLLEQLEEDHETWEAIARHMSTPDARPTESAADESAAQDREGAGDEPATVAQAQPTFEESPRDGQDKAAQTGEAGEGDGVGTDQDGSARDDASDGAPEGLSTFEQPGVDVAAADDQTFARPDLAHTDSYDATAQAESAEPLAPHEATAAQTDAPSPTPAEELSPPPSEGASPAEAADAVPSELSDDYAPGDADIEATRAESMDSPPSESHPLSDAPPTDEAPDVPLDAPGEGGPPPAETDLLTGEDGVSGHDDSHDAEGPDHDDQSTPAQAEADPGAGDDDQSAHEAAAAEAEPADEDAFAGHGGLVDRQGDAGTFGVRGEVELPSSDPVGDGQTIGERIEGTRQLVSAVARDLERGTPNREMLEYLGWSVSTLRTFVREYEDKLRDIDPTDLEEWLELEGWYGTGVLMAGVRTAESVGRADSGEVEDDFLAEDPSMAYIDEDISPEYRRLIEMYYQALADGRHPED